MAQAIIKITDTDVEEGTVSVNIEYLFSEDEQKDPNAPITAAIQYGGTIHHIFDSGIINTFVESAMSSFQEEVEHNG